MKSQYLFKLASAFAVAVGLGWTAAAGAQTPVLKMGVVSALTGPGSEWGLAQEGGLRIAADEANAKGGIKVGDKTYKISVTSYDDQYKAALSVAATRRLIEQDDIKFVFGPMGSAALLADKPLFEKNKVIAVIGAYTEKALDKDSHYLFRGFPTQTEFAGPIIKWIHEHYPKLKTVAEFEPNDETGWASQKILDPIYEANGFKVVSTELVERTVKDFQPTLTRVLALHPDAIELGTIPAGISGLIIRQARDMGFKGQFIKLGGPGVEAIVAAAGAQFADGLLYYAAANTTTPAYETLAAKYDKILKPPMNEFTVYYYDMATMLLEAIHNAGTVTDTNKVASAFEKLSPYKGFQGSIHWGGLRTYGINHQIITPVFVAQLKDGKQDILAKLND